MSEWGTVKLSDVADIRFSNVDKKTNAGEMGVLLCNYMDVYSNDYIDRGFQFMEASATPLEIEKFSVEQGDVIITKDSESPDDIGIPAVVMENIQRLVCGYHLALIKPKREKVDSVYLSKQIGSNDTVQYFARLASGSTRYGLSSLAISSTNIPLPPLAEQRKIGKILSSVDNLIDMTQTLIDKYQAIKQGMMHDLFTRGVDENGQLRHSYEETQHLYKESELGFIPKDWEVCPLEQKLTQIIDYRGKTPLKTDTGIPLITAKNVRLGFIDVEPREFIAETSYDRWMTRGIPNQGDILFTTEAPLGNVARIPEYKIALAQRLLTLTAEPKELVSDYLFWLLQWVGSRIRLEQRSSGSTVLGIKQSEFRRILFQFPLVEEQNKMVFSLNRIESNINTENNYLNKLKLMKSSLMQDLLTGNVRVLVDDEEKVAV